MLPFEDAPQSADDQLAALDTAARQRAIDPRFNVALEASAGTGKTRVLVDRYINLLRAGVDPSNILAITFTRKAAAEMRERIMTTLRAAAERGEIPPSRWRELRDRTGDIAISTIDAFCLSLLREFPLEADVDPGFSVADDTELPRLIDEALDTAVRICRSVAREDQDVALVFAQLGERRTRAALASLLQRRLVAPDVLAKYLARGPRDIDAAVIGRRGAAAIFDVFGAMRGGLDRFLETGPVFTPTFRLLARGLTKLQDSFAADTVDAAAVQTVFTRAREYFLRQDGEPRTRSPFPQRMYANTTDWRTHTALVVDHGAALAAAYESYRRDLNILLSRGIRRMFRIAESEYRRTLDAHAVLDFSDLLLKALEMLRRMEEFSRSRYRLESRYHHVLVDEFQDTSRAQWELVSLLIQAWREGAGLADGPVQPSIFIVGDRKQSIYAFRDADVSVLREAARHIEGLRPDRDVRRSISRSFRAVPQLLAFVNDVGHDVTKAGGDQAFEYEETDRFPVSREAGDDSAEALGLIRGASFEECADTTAGEIARLLAAGVLVRDRDTGLRRPATPGDIAILFRSRESHREFESALAQRGVPTYVYKGLGFFDADEIKDVMAAVRYLAEPESNLRAAALLRSRFFGLSDEALRRLSPRIASALESVSGDCATLDPRDASVLEHAREATGRWRGLVDCVPPAELLDIVLTESAYAFELRGPRLEQARQNLKKIRGLMRRMQNRGYQTMGRVAAHLDRLSVGDEANAVIDALDAVNLMTVHASKGLEFPIVFLMNLSRGISNRRDPVRWSREAVAVGERQPDVDGDHDVREREETKRLLYVALTRARDRLYLGTVLKDGRVVPTRGSLAEVLPATLLDRLGDNAGTVQWSASSGTIHAFTVCEPVESVAPPARTTADIARESDFMPLIDEASAPRSVASMIEAQAGAAFQSVPAAGDDSERVVGTLVHRLVHRFGLTPLAEIDVHSALGVLRAEEMSAFIFARTASELAADAIDAYRAICGLADIRALYDSGDVLHEVPFTMELDGRRVRGTIDCLIRGADGRITLLEFKTRCPRDVHRIQLDLYRRAVERLFPDATVDARLVYAAEAPA
jgi:ATP-dependent helicase/nuclease subunit A